MSLITHVLATVLVDLFTKGFGISKNDEDDDSKTEKSETAEGTGMGDGVGAKDVSDQIEDEDQLRGTDKKVYVVFSLFPPIPEFCMGKFHQYRYYYVVCAGRRRERAR